MREVLREEKKYLLHQAEALGLRNRLLSAIRADAHNGPDGYLVRSLYFDSMDDRDLREKLDGVELRRKLRLRVYSPDAEFALLEMKQKQGAYQRKRSLRLSREEAQALMAGEQTVLLRGGSDFGRECYAMMRLWAYRPKVLVEYDRFAFALPENSIRVTFDSRIRAGLGSLDVFDPAPPLSPALPWDQVVLEVKYNGFLLSHIKDLLRPARQSELSVSKYALARQTGCI